MEEGKKKYSYGLCLLSWEMACYINQADINQSKQAETWFIWSYRCFKSREDFQSSLNNPTKGEGDARIVMWCAILNELFILEHIFAL